MLRTGLAPTRERLERRAQRQAFLSQLRTGLDIDALLFETLGVTGAIERGDEIIHSCVLPFGMHTHGDRTPSASFNRQKLTVNCWVCGGGDIFWFVASVLDISVDDAITRMMGHLQPRERTASEFVAELETLWTSREAVSLQMPHYSERMVRPWLRYSEYLDGRGVTREVQERMWTGVDLNNRDLYESATIKEWILQPRITLPTFYGGVLRGWQKRKMNDGQIGPKYSSTKGFPKDRILYNLDSQTGDSVIVVESIASVLRLLSQGYDNVVATYGSEVNEDQLTLLRRFEKVYSFLDNDEAGRHGTGIMIEGLVKHVDLRIVPIEKEGTDPADYEQEDIGRMLEWAEPAHLWGVL